MTVEHFAYVVLLVMVWFSMLAGMIDTSGPIIVRLIVGSALSILVMGLVSSMFDREDALKQEFLFECGREGYNIEMCETLFQGGVKDERQLRKIILQQHLQ
jgi:hypothetical protein